MDVSEWRGVLVELAVAAAVEEVGDAFFDELALIHSY